MMEDAATEARAGSAQHVASRLADHVDWLACRPHRIVRRHARYHKKRSVGHGKEPRECGFTATADLLGMQTTRRGGLRSAARCVPPASAPTWQPSRLCGR